MEGDDRQRRVRVVLNRLAEHVRDNSVQFFAGLCVKRTVESNHDRFLVPVLMNLYQCGVGRDERLFGFDPVGVPFGLVGQPCGQGCLNDGGPCFALRDCVRIGQQELLYQIGQDIELASVRVAHVLIGTAVGVGNRVAGTLPCLSRISPIRVQDVKQGLGGVLTEVEQVQILENGFQFMVVELKDQLDAAQFPDDIGEFRRGGVLSPGLGKIQGAGGRRSQIHIEIISFL